MLQDEKLPSRRAGLRSESKCVVPLGGTEAFRPREPNSSQHIFRQGGKAAQVPIDALSQDRVEPIRW